MASPVRRRRQLQAHVRHPRDHRRRPLKTRLWATTPSIISRDATVAVEIVKLALVLSSRTMFIMPMYSRGVAGGTTVKRLTIARCPETWVSQFRTPSTRPGPDIESPAAGCGVTHTSIIIQAFQKQHPPRAVTRHSA